MREARRGGDVLVRRVLDREREARALRLPAWSVQRLEADGRVRGRTWRQMPGSNPIARACNWWLWKRGKLDLCEAQTEERAALDCAAGEEGGAA